jgi:5-methylcytosine-specific restriction endonuclease McrA
MSPRHTHRSHRVTLARAPRGLKAKAGLWRRARAARHPLAKRAQKLTALRDCGRRCVYCAQALVLERTTLDHVYPLAHGGADAPGNLVAACGPCNRMKGDMLPQEFFARYPWAGANFVRYARAVHRALKRGARRAVSLAYAA